MSFFLYCKIHFLSELYHSVLSTAAQLVIQPQSLLTSLTGQTNMHCILSQLSDWKPRWPFTSKDIVLLMSDCFFSSCDLYKKESSIMVKRDLGKSHLNFKDLLGDSC